MIKSLIIRRATYIGRTGNILQLFRLKMFVYIFDPKVAKLALPALLFPVSSVCCDFMLAIVILDVLFAAPCSIPPLIVCLPALMTLHCTYFVFGSLYLCFFLAEIPPYTPCWWPAVKPYDSLILEVLDRFCIFFASDTHTHMTMWFGPKSVENLHGRAQNEVIPMPNRKWQNLRGGGSVMGKIDAEKLGKARGSCSVCSAQIIRRIIKGLYYQILFHTFYSDKKKIVVG